MADNISPITGLDANSLSLLKLLNGGGNTYNAQAGLIGSANPQEVMGQGLTDAAAGIQANSLGGGLAKGFLQGAGLGQKVKGSSKREQQTQALMAELQHAQKMNDWADNLQRITAVRGAAQQEAVQNGPQIAVALENWKNGDVAGINNQLRAMPSSQAAWALADGVDPSQFKFDRVAEVRDGQNTKLIAIWRGPNGEVQGSAGHSYEELMNQFGKPYADAKAATELQNNLTQLSLQEKISGIDKNNAAAAKDRAEAERVASGRPSPDKAIQIEKTLRDDFQQQSKEYGTVADFYQRAMNGYEAGKAGNPQGDQTLLFSFMKVLDPTSVVRESEYATAASFRGLPEGLWQQFEKARSGEVLAPGQRENIMQQMNRMFADKANQQLGNEKNYADAAERKGVGVDDVMMGIPSVHQISPTFAGVDGATEQVEAKKSLNGKDYVKIKGQWFEQ